MTCNCAAHNGFLTAKGLREAAQRTLLHPEVDGMQHVEYVDSRVSVSGLELERDNYEFIVDSQIDEQARRFHNGS